MEWNIYVSAASKHMVCSYCMLTVDKQLLGGILYCLRRHCNPATDCTGAGRNVVLEVIGLQPVRGSSCVYDTIPSTALRNMPLGQNRYAALYVDCQCLPKIPLGPYFPVYPKNPNSVETRANVNKRIPTGHIRFLILSAEHNLSMVQQYICATELRGVRVHSVWTGFQPNRSMSTHAGGDVCCSSPCSR